MIINDKNQNDIFDEMEIDYVFSNNPINRIHKIDEQENKTQLLVDLEKKIQNIENCDLKRNAKKIVFSDGKQDSNSNGDRNSGKSATAAARWRSRAATMQRCSGTTPQQCSNKVIQQQQHSIC